LPGLYALHLRPTHAGDGPLRGARRAGRGAWQLHHGPVYLAARALAALLRPPHLLGPLGLLAGYLEAALRGERQALPPELVRHLRREQRARLLGALADLLGRAGGRGGEPA
ncbi:MAG TPA: hypothetical protein P5076_13440, partial [Myxococcota bacterium]|nr:hypothetical protein [Myxococcota bacterium]